MQARSAAIGRESRCPECWRLPSAGQQPLCDGPVGDAESESVLDAAMCPRLVTSLWVGAYLIVARTPRWDGLRTSLSLHLTGRLSRVVSVGRQRPRGAEPLEVTGFTVLPGLIDLHTHMGILSVADPEAMPPAVAAAQLFRNAELCLQSGHTTAREVAGADGGLRRAIDVGLIAGPRLFPRGRRCASPAATGTSARRSCRIITTRACPAWRR
jgi:hypothetical protein